MKQRCRDTTHVHYHNYGGRGIKVCNEWLNDYSAFRDWALANGYQEKLTLDRIDNDGDYCPENCRWQTIKQQSNNRRTNKFITFNGTTKTMAEWADHLGITRHCLYQRFKIGWSVEKALTPKGR